MIKRVSFFSLIGMLLYGCAANVWETACDLMPRLQEPKDRPYIVRKVMIEGGGPGVSLAGELTLPEGPGPFPGVVLISGSALVDRDSKVLGHKPFLVLADYLTRSGYAVLRHDDRGVGESTGDAYNATDKDFALDSARALNWLRRQSEVNGAQVGFVGHSQGGSKAPMAAQIEKPGFMIFLAGGVQPIGTLLLQQAHDLGILNGTPQQDLDEQARELREIFDILVSSDARLEAQERITEFALGEGASNRHARKLAEGYATPWMFAEFKRSHDPYADVDERLAQLISSYDGPILAIYGEKDLLVSASINAPLTEPLLTHPMSEVVTLPDLNHFLQPAEKGDIEEMCEIEITMDPWALELIGAWMEEVIE